MYILKNVRFVGVWTVVALIKKRKQNNIQYTNSEKKLKRYNNTDPNSLQNDVLTVKVSSILALMEVYIDALNLHKVDHKIGQFSWLSCHKADFSVD